jgi:hypothetical protein
MPPCQPKDVHADERLRALGQRVRDTRRSHGQSQEVFAHACGVHRTGVGRRIELVVGCIGERRRLTATGGRVQLSSSV